MVVGDTEIGGRVRMADYLCVAQIYLRDNYMLERSLVAEDVKPRLLGHWGTCHGINVAWANLEAGLLDLADFEVWRDFVVGVGHGFPAVQANLFLDGVLEKYYPKATVNAEGVAYICGEFSWPYGFPSHSFPGTPGVIQEGGELGYALATAYGAVLGRPERLVACLIGDGEFETGTALASMNANKLVASEGNGRVLPMLHLNGYKISGPTIYGRKSERELMQMLRGFGYEPAIVNGDDTKAMQEYIQGLCRYEGWYDAPPFLVMRTEKGETGPRELRGEKIAGNYLSHQVPLAKAKTDAEELVMLEEWLRSYNFEELFDGIAR